MTSICVLYNTHSESCLLSQIQTYSGVLTSYSGIFSHIVTYLEPCVTLAYSKPCHIQIPSVFRTQDIFRTLSRHILAYPERCITLAYWEPCHIQNFSIQNFGTFRTLGNPEFCLYRHIHAYSGIFNDDSYNSH